MGKGLGKGEGYTVRHSDAALGREGRDARRPSHLIAGPLSSHRCTMHHAQGKVAPPFREGG